MDSRRMAVCRAWNLYLGGLLDRHANAIRAYFDPSPLWRSRLDSWEQAQPREETRIGVHVRRGDYATYQGGRYFFGNEVYVRRMHEIQRQLGGRTQFVICSDEEFDFSLCTGLDVLRGPCHELLDLLILANCRFIVGPPSTYTAWASWYGRVPRWIMTVDEPLRLSEFREHRFT
jgi:hypothetical protein